MVDRARQYFSGTKVWSARGGRTYPRSFWLSDVLAGATLGYIVGRTTVRVNGAPLEAKRPMVTVSPILGRDVRGVQVAVSF